MTGKRDGQNCHPSGEGCYSRGLNGKLWRVVVSLELDNLAEIPIGSLGSQFVACGIGSRLSAISHTRLVEDITYVVSNGAEADE